MAPASRRSARSGAERVMIDKKSEAPLSFAGVLGFGGFLGVGGDHAIRCPGSR